MPLPIDYGLRARWAGEGLAFRVLPPATGALPPRWHLLWPLCAAGLLLRIAIGLYGDSLVHPDEVFQTLEPAHRLVHGAGIGYWEQAFGGRFFFLPGLVAAVLWSGDLVGLDTPRGYVPLVRITFCVLSMLLPLAAYAAMRRLYGETAARALFVAALCWYELAAFAHKPMPSVVGATALTALLALILQPPTPKITRVVPIVAALVLALRPQYLPAAAGLVLLYAARCAPEFSWGAPRLTLALWTAGAMAVVGLADGAVWDGSVFHSLRANAAYNEALRARDAAAWLLPVWWHLYALAAASGGLAALSGATMLIAHRRHATVLFVSALILVPHMLWGHKEYRHVFAGVILWMMPLADLAVRTAEQRGRLVRNAFIGAFAAVTALGAFHQLPHQSVPFEGSYYGFTDTKHPLRLVHPPDSLVAAYDALAEDATLQGLWHADRAYYETPGYYHLHRQVPWYDQHAGEWLKLHEQPALLRASVSHVLTEDPERRFEGFAELRRHGPWRTLRRTGPPTPVRQWLDYHPDMFTEWEADVVAAVASRRKPVAGFAFKPVKTLAAENSLD